MRALIRRTAWAFCTALMLVVPRLGAADTVDFWVGFGGLQTAPHVRYTPVMVGTNETSDPKTYNVVLILSATGPDGFQCTITTEVTGKFHPAVTMPIRFQASYPQAVSSGLLKRGPKLVPPVSYTLKATINNIQLNSAHSQTRRARTITSRSPLNMPGEARRTARG